MAIILLKFTTKYYKNDYTIYIQYIKREDKSYSEGVNLEKLNINVNAPDINEKLGNERKILFVGNLHPNKGTHFLLKSFTLVKSKINYVNL
jgi:glycosyltransferase involved in cell wall biosynthesis